MEVPVLDSDYENPSESSDSEESPRNNKRKLSPKTAKTKKTKLNDSPDKPVKTKKKNELLKPPTVEELNNLKMTENLYNNNLFRLQIEELLKEVAIKQKRQKALKNWLDGFLKSLNELPEYRNVTLSSIKATKTAKSDKFLQALATKYKCPMKTDLDLQMSFIKPTSASSFGLFNLASLAGPNLETSINISMPKECFLVKDFLNNRYLVKRFYYLIYLFKNLTANSKEIVLHDSNPLLPIIQLQPTDDPKITVKIYVTPLQDYFKPSRFLPDQNNMKKDLFESGISDIEELKTTPTLLYNSVLAHDVTLAENSSFVQATLSEQTSIQDGIKLLTVWLKQRELHLGWGGFTPTLLMYLITYMVVKKKISKLMSSYQVARNFWNFMATTDLQVNAISLKEGAPLEQFKAHYDLVFLDRTGCYNLTAFLDLGVYKKVKFECELAMRHLNDSGMESFQALFLSQVPFALQYDLLLDVTESLPLQNNFVSTDKEKAHYIGFEEFHSIKLLTNLLQRGLNQRALYITPRVLVNQDGIKQVTFGVKLNAETAFNFIEMGPPLSDTAKAEDFRQFWGYLSSDRRFRDGSTNVAVYFKTATIRSKRAIIKRIVKYLLSEKLQLKFRLFYDEFEEVLINKKVVSPYVIGTNEEASLKIVALADELGQKLRSVQMSLSITGIQGISEAFSYTEAFPPLACRFRPAEGVTEVKGVNVVFGKKLSMAPRYIQPLDMVLHLEHSSKWPNDLEAVRHIKTSFYLEISNMLKDSHNIISRVSRDYLEVFFQGLVFRYRLYVAKEVALMKKDLTDTGSTTYLTNADSEDYEKTLNILPKVIGALKGLQMQFPSFGPGTALIKRWLRSQLIDHHLFPDVALDLVNASLYLNHTSFDETCTPQVSFLRFLKFFSEFQWELQPLVVNFNEEISKEDLTELETSFQQQPRESLQPLYVITPYDQGRSVFTRPSPTRPVLNRVKQLAKATLDLATARVNNLDLFDVKDLFKPNLSGYNLLIHLRPLLNPKRHEQVDGIGDSKIVLEAYQHHPKEKIPITGWDPVESYLRTLWEQYGEFASFFHDSCGGNVVGVLWHPVTRDVKDFKVSNVSGRHLQKDKLVFNEEAIIEDFYLLGKGLVKWIEKK